MAHKEELFKGKEMGIVFFGGGLNYEMLEREVNETLTSPITELKKALMSSLVIMATNPYFGVSSYSMLIA